jgi:hypothetical protein
MVTVTDTSSVLSGTRTSTWPPAKLLLRAPQARSIQARIVNNSSGSTVIPGASRNTPGEQSSVSQPSTREQPPIHDPHAATHPHNNPRLMSAGAQHDTLPVNRSRLADLPATLGSTAQVASRWCIAVWSSTPPPSWKGAANGPLLLLPRCESDGARAPCDGELARADVVPMHRMRRVRPRGLLFVVPSERMRLGRNALESAPKRERHEPVHTSAENR